MSRAPRRTTERPAGKYTTSLADLEASVHVAVDDQVAEQAEAPAPSVLSQSEVERQTFLRIAGAP